jgi:LysM repeat protein
MNREDPYRDQAERLRKKIAKNQEEEQVPELEDLPPRSRLHHKKRKKNKFKVKYPIIRLLALFFILLPITIFSMYYINSGKIGGSQKVSNNQSGFETVGYDDGKEDKATIIEEREVPSENVSAAEAEKAKEIEKEIETHIPVPQKPEVVNDTDKSSASEEEEKKEPKKGKVVYHTVKPNETIFRISMNYFNSPSGIEIIRKANNLKDNEIQAGQVLTIPAQ